MNILFLSQLDGAHDHVLAKWQVPKLQDTILSKNKTQFVAAEAIQARLVSLSHHRAGGLARGLGCSNTADRTTTSPTSERSDM